MSRSAGALVAGVSPVLVFAVAALFSGGFTETTYSFLLAGTCLGLTAAASFVRPPRPSAAVLALAAFTGLTLLSGAWGDWGDAVRVAPLAGLYTAVLYAVEWCPPGLPLRALRYALALAALAGIAGRATGFAAPSPEPGSIRMAWPVGYANGLGLVCAMGVVACLALRPRFYPGAALCAAALVWTFSRSALIALALGAVVVAAQSGRVRIRTLLAVACVLAVLAAVFAHPLATAFRRPVPDSRDEQRLVTLSGHGRTELWHLALREGEAHPVAGGGAGTWRAASVERSGRKTLPANAHSLELETFAELGVAGLAILAVFHAAVFRRRGEPAAVALFAMWAAVAAVDWDWQLPAVTVPALIAAGTVTATRRQERWMISQRFSRSIRSA